MLIKEESSLLSWDILRMLERQYRLGTSLNCVRKIRKETLRVKTGWFCMTAFFVSVVVVVLLESELYSTATRAKLACNFVLPTCYNRVMKASLGNNTHTKSVNRLGGESFTTGR